MNCAGSCHVMYQYSLETLKCEEEGEREGEEEREEEREGGNLEYLLMSRFLGFVMRTISYTIYLI